MKKPRRFLVFYHHMGRIKDFYTDNENTAKRKAVFCNGTYWVDTRYEAKLRLYGYLKRKELYTNKIVEQ